MKTSIKINLLKSSVAILCFFIIGFSGYGANTATVTLQNCSSTSNTITFDLILTNTSGSDNVLNCFQTGIDFNYAGIINGGKLSIAFVAGSSELNANHNKFNSTNLFIDPVSHQLRMTAQIVLSQAAGSHLAANTPVRIGTFRIMNSTVWTPSSSANFSFNTLTSTKYRTQTLVATYIDAVTADAAVVERSIGCSSLLNPNPTTGIAPLSDLSTTGIVAYPNPVRNKLYVDFGSENSDKYLIKMFDVTGAVLIETNYSAQKGQNLVELDLSNYAKGVYILSLTSATDSKKLSVVVE